MNTSIHCQFSAPTEFLCAIQRRELVQTGWVARIWKPVRCRALPRADRAGRRDCLFLELDSPRKKPTKANQNQIMKTKLQLISLMASAILAFSGGGTRASIAYGTINNFDTVNDTGTNCHGFEIEIEDIHSRDITYTYNWNHYGTPKITEDNSNPLHPKVRVRYESGKTTNGAWTAYTAIPSGPIASTDGHRFTNTALNFGGEHFGVGYRGTPTNICYFWLVDDGAGVLVRGPSVLVGTPRFNYAPPGGGVPAQVQAVIKPPPAPPVLEFGPASWVKEIRTTSHNNNEVKLRDLVSDDPDFEDEKNWRNGEPDEVEVEWQLLQTEFNKPAGGANGELEAAPEDLNNGDEIVTRRYEFYKYVGPLDNETGEAKADKVGPDGIHGEGIKVVNGVTVDLATNVVVGDYLGSQMSAFDNELPVGLVEHLPDGKINQLYATRTVVIAAVPVSITTTGALPAGLTFSTVTGELSGTPTASGIFNFGVRVTATNQPVQARNYTFVIAAAGEIVPPHSTVETSASPIESGITTGGGFYTNGTVATVMATPAPGFAFAKWTESGKAQSSSSSYLFTNLVNRSLVANFVPAPQLSLTAQLPGALVITWPTNFTGFVLQQNSDLGTTNWLIATNPASVVGTNKQVTITPLNGNGFFRLVRP